MTHRILVALANLFEIHRWWRRGDTRVMPSTWNVGGHNTRLRRNMRRKRR